MEPPLSLSPDDQHLILLPPNSDSSLASPSPSPSPSSSISFRSLPIPNPSSGSLFGSFLSKHSFSRIATSPISRRLFGNPLSAHRFPVPEWSDELFIRPADGERVEQSYSDRTMIDWAYEDRKERARLRELRMRRGLPALIARLIDLSWPWAGVVLVGAAVALVAGCLDVLALWLGDLRSGRCGYAFYLNKSACCSGLEPHEICYEWITWPEVFGISYAPLVAFAQYLLYILTSIVFAGLAAVLVKAFAPFAFHTGIPEIKVILSGYIFQHYLSAWTLAIKAIGLAFAVASGLSLGKEGPLVHVACCVANLVLQPFKVFRTNQARKREMLSAAAAAGVSVAFGAPLGGVLFVLEELSLASLPQTALWRSFVCAVVATMTLQYFDPFKSGKLVLFQVQSVGQVWRAFELVPWVFIGLCGGLFGAGFIRANIEFAKIRRSSSLVNYPIREVVAIAGFTALTSYLLLITRVPISQLVEALFRDCSSNTVDEFSFCDSTRAFSTVILLLICGAARAVVTAITFGIQVPSGIFLPAISIGACFGRAVGIAMHAWQQAYPRFWLFGACPPEGSCISPQVYAVIGAASAVGGLTRMTISLVVIVFELTGAVELVLQIMMAVMISKFTADYVSTDGIYEAWINFRGYPYLSSKKGFKKEGATAEQVMVKEIVSLPAKGWTLDRLEEKVRKHHYKGFPIVMDEKTKVLMGYVPGNELRFALSQERSRPENSGSTMCQFFSDRQNIPSKQHLQSAESSSNRTGDQAARFIDLNKWVDEVTDVLFFKREIWALRLGNYNKKIALCFFFLDCWGWSLYFFGGNLDWKAPLTLEPETPMEVVLQYFQRLGLRNMLFTSHGVLSGILTIKDVHKYIRAPFYSTGSRSGVRSRGESSVRSPRESRR